jgi:hypothetical protein
MQDNCIFVNNNPYDILDNISIDVDDMNPEKIPIGLLTPLPHTVNRFQTIDSTCEYREINSYFSLAIENTKRILNIYKSISHMTPNWQSLFTDTRSDTQPDTHPDTHPDPHPDPQPDTESESDQLNKNNVSIFNDIMYFVMTRTIDEKYQNISNHRNCINNPFQRAVWHMGSATDFSQNTYEVHMYMTLINAYCLLSREKTLVEFEEFCERINKRNKHKNNDDISTQCLGEIPYWIYNMYHNKSYPNTLLNCPFVHNKINSGIFYDYLCRAFEKPSVRTCSTIHNNITPKNTQVEKQQFTEKIPPLLENDKQHKKNIENNYSSKCNVSKYNRFAKHKKNLLTIKQKSVKYQTDIKPVINKSKIMNQKPMNQKPMNQKPMNQKPMNQKPINQKFNSDRANWRND